MSTLFNKSRIGAVLGLSALLSVGLSAVELTPAAARHRHRHYRYRSSDGYYSRYDRGPSNWWWNNERGEDRYRPYRDRDGDGISNRSDRDIDGDGRPNWRDDHPFDPRRR